MEDKNEDTVHRPSKSKRSINKIMFLIAVACPQYDYEKDEMFAGKIRIWLFAENIESKKIKKNTKGNS